MFMLNTKSLFKLKVDKEYYSLLNDLIKFPLILFVMNILLYFTEKNRKRIFSRQFSKIFMFLIVAICFYHMILDKVVSLETSN